MSKSDELLAELRSVVFTQNKWFDSVIPPVAFIILNAFTNLELALAGAIIIALLIGIYRLVRRQAWVYALGGVGGVIIAGLIAWFIGGAEGYFLPGIISGALTAV
ncbi:MAG: DUF3159 domain-containing protein, partial [Gammaproteobacteria bacterium]|nr:DUF3159 domain-containing protein [Gammaproteobacteria bacterium]